MSDYGFVSKQMINQMDSIADQVKAEINSQARNREKYFDEIRSFEKEHTHLASENAKLREEFERLSREYSELISID